MNSIRHGAVGEYLRRLQRAMTDLPAERRDEILIEIEEHIAQGMAELPTATDADVRNVLERVGDPDDIAADARERFGVQPAVPRERRGRARWLVGGVLAAVVLVAAVAVFLLTAGSSPEITRAQFNRVAVGDSKQDVSRKLGGPGKGESIVSGLDPRAVEIPDAAGQQVNDCWTYALTGSGVTAGSDAAACFVADQVVYTRVRAG